MCLFLPPCWEKSGLSLAKILKIHIIHLACKQSKILSSECFQFVWILVCAVFRDTGRMMAFLWKRGAAAGIHVQGAQYLMSRVSIPGFISSLCRHPFVMLMIVWHPWGFSSGFFEFCRCKLKETPKISLILDLKDLSFQCEVKIVS